MIDAIRNRISEHMGEPVALMQVGAGRHWQDKILLFCWKGRERDPSLVCRVSRTERGSGWLRQEARARARAVERLPLALQASIPWARIEEFPFGTVLIEPWIPGQSPPVPAALPQIERYAKRTLEWLRAFSAATRLCAPPRALARPAAELLDIAARSLPDSHLRTWAQSQHSHVGILDRVSSSTVHGDFWRGNLRTRGGELKVLDWEFIQLSGNPYFDPVLNLVSVCHELPGGEPERWFERCFLEDTRHSRLFGKLLEEHGPEPFDREACALTVSLALIEHAVRGPDSWREAKLRLVARAARERRLSEKIQRALWP